MKKLFLTMLAVVISTAVFAQQRNELGLERVSRVQAQPQLKANTISLYDALQARAPKRAEDETSLYFAKPSGCLYYQANIDGQGYGPTVLFLPAFNEYCFTNMSSNPASCYWTVSNYDASDYVDADNNLWWNIGPNTTYFWPAPMLWNSSRTEYYEMPNYRSGGDYGSDLANFPWLDWIGFNNITAGIGIYGGLDNYNISGTGTYDGYYTSIGVIQDCPAPASPLYFDELYVIGRTSSSTGPLKNGAELSMEFYDITDPQNPVLKETLTASNDGYTKWSDDSPQYGRGEYGTLIFTKKGFDPLFGDTEEAVTIDYPFEIQLFGFDNSDVDFGPGILDFYECDPELSEAEVILLDPEDNNMYYLTYRDPAGLALSFHGIMDVALVADTLSWSYNGETLATVAGYNTIIFSEDGQECYNDVPEEWALFTDGTGAVYADITCPWFDEDNSSIENYYFTNVPDWVTEIIVDDEYYDPDNYYYAVYVKFVAEALPSGTTYRAATTHLHGRGYQSDVPIYLLQGNIPEGIESIPAAAATNSNAKGTYNLAGQRVSDSAKGILVRDGKKFINK